MEPGTMRSGLPRQEADDVGDRLHVCVGATCNNNCIFCMEIDREDRLRRVGAQTDDDVHRMLVANRGVTEVLFTSGEPTLNPGLPRYVSWAAEAGYRVVGVISNGRRFAYEPFLRGLLDRGMNNVIVSIHGHDSRTHDALTRTRGSFDQTLAGLRNLSALRDRYPFRIQTSTVVNRRNLATLDAFCALMATLDIDQHVFNVMMPDGRGEAFFDSLMPRYPDVRDAFARMVPTLSPEFLGRVALVDIPYCATEGLPDAIRGYVERYFHYEPAGSFEERAGVASIDLPPDEAGRLFHDRAIEGDRADFSKVTRTVQERFVKTKRPECAACRYDGLCRGAWKPYVERFGWDELAPVRS
jgi:cyclic pyranopterin phosphate synthase